MYMHAPRRVRNQDGDPIASDSVYFVKNTACPNQKGLSLTPPATPTPPATSAAPAAPSPPPATVPVLPPVTKPVVPVSPPQNQNLLDGLSAAKNAVDTGELADVLAQQSG